MAAFETDLEMAQRHVRQGEKRVARQQEIIADIIARNQPTDVADAFLVNLESSLDTHHRHLARLVSI